MDQKPLISVIVPVYNAEASLERTLQALCGQTLGAIEVVAVDDGSTDGSRAMLEEWAARDDRVRVVATGNRGAFLAREAGLREARGRYVGFCDAGDVPAPSMGARLLARAEETGADIVTSAYERVMPDGSATTEMASFGNGVRPLGPECGWLASVNTALWNKLYRAELLEHRLVLDAPPRIMEDALFLLALYSHTRSMAFVAEPLYRYQVEDGSAMGHLDAEELNGLFAAWGLLRERVAKAAPGYLALLDTAAFVHLGVSAPLMLLDLPRGEAAAALARIGRELDERFPLHRSSPFLGLAYAREHPTMGPACMAHLLARAHLLGPALRAYRALSKATGGARW